MYVYKARIYFPPDMGVNIHSYLASDSIESSSSSQDAILTLFWTQSQPTAFATVRPGNLGALTRFPELSQII